MPTFELEHFLPYRLSRASALVSQAFQAIYGPDHDLTVPEWRVLATLGQFEQMTAKAIGKHSSMHKTKVSRAVRDLELRRWLRRKTSRHDRREEDLSLTQLGRAAYQQIVPKALAFEGQLFEALGQSAPRLLAALDAIDTLASRREPVRRAARAVGER